jgi:hypothetical protein
MLNGTWNLLTTGQYLVTHEWAHNLKEVTLELLRILTWRHTDGLISQR